MDWREFIEAAQDCVKDGDTAADNSIEKSQHYQRAQVLAILGVADTLAELIRLLEPVEFTMVHDR